MAKTLNSITVNSPAGAVSAAVNDTFTFSGTPGFSGTGGVNRYDWKWEVNSGGGFVTIGAATGLTTAGTNPLINTASASLNSLTVTCAQAGSYTIRISGAPTTGGSYTVLSATRTVTVSLAAIAGTMAAAEAGSDSAAVSGAVAGSGSLAASETGSDVLAVSGALAIGGTLAVAESGADVFDGISGFPAISGALGAVEAGADIAALSGALSIGGALSASDAGFDVFAGQGAAGDAATLAAIEAGSDAVVLVGSVAIAGQLLGLEAGNDSILVGAAAYAHKYDIRTKLADGPPGSLRDMALSAANMSWTNESLKSYGAGMWPDMARMGGNVCGEGN